MQRPGLHEPLRREAEPRESPSWLVTARSANAPLSHSLTVRNPAPASIEATEARIAKLLTFNLLDRALHNRDGLSRNISEGFYLIHKNLGTGGKGVIAHILQKSHTFNCACT